MIFATKKLKDVAVIRTGKLDSNAAVANGQYPFFTCDPVTLRIDKWAYDTEAVLLAGNNASGNYTAKYFCGKFNAYQRTYIIESSDKTKFNTKYLCYVLNQKLRLLKTMSSGSATKFLTLRMLHDLGISCPSINTQDKIADVLGSYDDLVENNRKQIKLLEEAAQRLYKEWFIDLRFPGWENTHIHDGIPEGWSYRELSDVFDFIRGKSYSSNELSESKGTLMVNLKNIRAFGGYNRNAEKRFTGSYKDTQILKPGDVIMGVTDMTKERRLVGHVALVPDLGEDMIFSMDLIKLVPKCVLKSYLYSTFFYGGFSYKISPLANGVNVLHLKPESMLDLQMLVPRMDVMQAYDQVFSSFNKRIDLLEKQMSIAVESRDRLLPKLMNGEMEV